MDPRINALAAASATPRFHEGESARAEREALVQHALRDGLASLDKRDRGRLLNDPVALSKLHLEAWTSAGAAPEWSERRG
jgi:membrane glycosyltransferase